jgi:hypothetical protein
MTTKSSINVNPRGGRKRDARFMMSPPDEECLTGRAAVRRHVRDVQPTDGLGGGVSGERLRPATAEEDEIGNRADWVSSMAPT